MATKVFYQKFVKWSGKTVLWSVIFNQYQCLIILFRIMKALLHFAFLQHTIKKNTIPSIDKKWLNQMRFSNMTMAVHEQMLFLFYSALFLYFVVNRFTGVLQSRVKIECVTYLNMLNLEKLGDGGLVLGSRQFLLPPWRLATSKNTIHKWSKMALK